MMYEVLLENRLYICSKYFFVNTFILKSMFINIEISIITSTVFSKNMTKTALTMLKKREEGGKNTHIHRSSCGCHFWSLRSPSQAFTLLPCAALIFPGLPLPVLNLAEAFCLCCCCCACGPGLSLCLLLWLRVSETVSHVSQSGSYLWPKP